MANDNYYPIEISGGPMTRVARFTGASIPIIDGDVSDGQVARYDADSGTWLAYSLPRAPEWTYGSNPFDGGLLATTIAGDFFQYDGSNGTASQKGWVYRRNEANDDWIARYQPVNP